MFVIDAAPYGIWLFHGTMTIRAALFQYMAAYDTSGAVKGV